MQLALNPRYGDTSDVTPPHTLTSYAMTAKLKTSALSLYGCLRYTSGAMYIRVPVRPSCSSCPATWAV